MKRLALNHLIIASITLIIAIFTSCKEKEVAKEPSLLTETAENTDNGKLLESVEESDNKESNNVKLLKTITDADGILLQDFEYDEQNRLVNIIHPEGYGETKISYTDKRITVENKAAQQQFTYYNIKDNKVTFILDLGSGERLETCKIDKQGYLLSYKSGLRTGCGDYVEEEDAFKEAPYFEKYKYEDGNLTTITNNACNGGGTSAGGSTDYKYDSQKSPFTNCTTPKWLLQYLLNSYNYVYNGSKNNVIETLFTGDCWMIYLHKYEYDSDGFPTKHTIEYNSKESVSCGDEMLKTGTTHYNYRGETKKIMGNKSN